MTNQTEQSIKLMEGYPYLIGEIENRVFVRIESMSEREGGVRYQYSYVHPELRLGIDIRETPTHDLTIAVRIIDPMVSGRNLNLRGNYKVYQELIKLSEVSGHDYVALPIGSFPKGTSEEGDFILIKPRLFNRIVNN